MHAYFDIDSRFTYLPKWEENRFSKHLVVKLHTSHMYVSTYLVLLLHPIISFSQMFMMIKHLDQV